MAYPERTISGQIEGFFCAYEGDCFPVHSNCLYFYTDGLVLNVCIIGDVRDDIKNVLKWFNREKYKRGFGAYRLNGDDIEFTMHYPRDPGAKKCYSGKCRGSQMVLDMLNIKENRRLKAIRYSLYKV